MNAFGQDPAVQTTAGRHAEPVRAGMGGSSLLVVNPAARNGRADLGPVLAMLNAAGGAATIVEVAPPAELAAQVETALRAGLRRIVVAGGDGTINSALRAVLAARVPLGVIPLGTANDFARTLGIPVSPADAAAVIASGFTRRIDVGIVNDAHFLNAAGVGFSAELHRELDGLKGRLGPLAYPLGVLRGWHRRRSFTVAIRGDGVAYQHRALQVTVANGRFYGGGMTAHTDARIDDGTLDVIVVPPRPLWRYAIAALGFKRGDYAKSPVIALQATRFELHTRRREPVSADGEIRTFTPASFSVASAALEVYVPDAPA